MTFWNSRSSERENARQSGWWSKRPHPIRRYILIERYTFPEMAEIWSEESKLQAWLEVELAIVDALSEQGSVPKAAAQRIRQSARFDIQKVKRIESVIKHDLLAFVENVGESLGPDSRYFHMGVTSSDVLDTSLALLLGAAAKLIIAELTQLRSVIARLAVEHEKTLTVGRTHGMHAEPTSLGLKFAVWYNDVVRAIERIETAREEVCVGKVSGAVGNYSHLAPRIEDIALHALRLKPERPATQIVQRDRHAHFISCLALAASVMEKAAVELRNLQRTEIAEAEEPFASGQKGSSSMPHKRNPITLERISGLARLVRSYAASALENIALWHERDISHSSVERVILPDSTTVVHYMARNLRLVLEGLRIDQSRMRRNIDATGGRIYSQRLMLRLMEAGWERRRAYEKVQHLAQLSVSKERNLKDIVKEDTEIGSVIKVDAIEDMFDPHFYTRYVHEILHDAGLV
jgi:adenylosuccinate lyase